MKKSDSLEKRFWANVLTTDNNNCWEWQGALNTEIYGIRYGVIGHNYKRKYAHRISYELNNGEIPKGMCVLHKCDNTLCVNPNHLFLGTTTDNGEDRDRKGRQAKGEKHGMRKLTEEQVKVIFSDSRSSRKIAKDYNINKSQILKIKNGTLWRCLNLFYNSQGGIQ